MSDDIFDDDDCDGDESMCIESRFSRAAEYLQKNYSKFAEKDLLEIYGLFKQSTCGECNTSTPGIFNMHARTKWYAWKNLGNLDSTQAMELYIKKITDINPDWDIKNNNENKSGWVCLSVHQPTEEDEICEKDKTVFDYVKENNSIKLKEMLSIDKINNLDSTGLGLIHWATDRNSIDILEYLLKAGANINLQDSDGQTALHYATSCGHMECIKILLKFGADSSIVDQDGCTCLDVAFDSKIKDFF